MELGGFDRPYDQFRISEQYPQATTMFQKKRPEAVLRYELSPRTTSDFPLLSESGFSTPGRPVGLNSAYSRIRHYTLPYKLEPRNTHGLIRYQQ